MVEKQRHPREKVIERYFDLLREIQERDVQAVDRILDLWDEDGICTFIGVPPLAGEYRGQVALRSLYQGIAHSREEPVREVGKIMATDFEVSEPRIRGDKTFVVWDSKIRSEKDRGFTLSGSNTFRFKEGKISRLEIVLAPRPTNVEGFSLDELSVRDIGRLSMAAWAVV